MQEECISGSFSGVPGDCGSYHACLWGRHETFQCAPGLHFNKDSNICDWPSHANCQEKSNEAPAPPSIDMDGPIDEKPSIEHPIPTQRPTKAPLESMITQKPWSEVTTQKPKPLPSPEVDSNKDSPLSGHYKVRNDSQYLISNKL